MLSQVINLLIFILNSASTTHNLFADRLSLFQESNEWFQQLILSQKAKYFECVEWASAQMTKWKLKIGNLSNQGSDVSFWHMTNQVSL